MLVVVAVNFRVTFKADGNRILDIVCAVNPYWNDVVGFDLDSAEAVANAAAPVTANEQI